MHQDPSLLKTPVSAQSDNSSQAVKKQTHYRLTNEEWLQAVHDLKPRERDVLYYLRTLDPFGDRQLDIGVRDIARLLNCDASTVSRALKTLDVKGYIALELVNVQLKVLSTGNGVVWKQQDRSLRNKVDRETTRSIATQQSRSSRNDRPLEVSPDIDSGTPHTLHTDQTLKTLPSQRELLNFVVKQIKQDKQVRQPRAYALQCLEKDREFWIEEFERYQNRLTEIKGSEARPTSHDFENESIEVRRDRVLRMWRAGHRIAVQQILADSELGLIIDGDELREVTEP